MIELDAVAFAYGTTPVLRDISATFLPGGFHGIFGPNGCGKSTLLKLITGELSPDSGRVSPRWRDPRERARRIAVVTQEIPPRIPLSVREIVALGRYPWERSSGENAGVEQVLRELNLAGIARAAYSSLSGGERQRVMLARAMAQDTPVLLLDEPASSLDVGFQHTFYALLRDWAGSGKCVIMVSHDLFVAPQYLDDALLLHRGRVLHRGAPAEALAAENLRTAYSGYRPAPAGR